MNSKNCISILLFICVALVRTPTNGQAPESAPAPSLVAPPPTEPAFPARERAPAPIVAKGASANYVLSPNDVINIRVFQEDDLLTTTRLAQDGVIVFPLLGSVKVGGRTTEDATKHIRDLLEQDYLVNPQVTITIVEFAKRRFSVLGEVSRPGTYDMPDDQSVNLLQAISMAGGYTKIANPGKITVRRNEDGKEIVYQLDAKTMARDGKARIFELKPEDTITVAESIF